MLKGAAYVELESGWQKWDGFFFFDINLIELFDFLNFVNALFWLKVELKYVCDFGILFTIIPVVVLL